MIVVKMHVSKSSQKCSIQVKTISLELAETRGPLLSLSLSLSLCITKQFISWSPFNKGWKFWTVTFKGGNVGSFLTQTSMEMNIWKRFTRRDSWSTSVLFKPKTRTWHSQKQNNNSQWLPLEVQLCMKEKRGIASDLDHAFLHPKSRTKTTP
jgi:hypothetical protein